jgi:iron complex transport system substrate-binding protein
LYRAASIPKYRGRALLPWNAEGGCPPGGLCLYHCFVLDDNTPRRVVCLQPSATVILAAVGMLDRVVACTKYCADVCPEVRSGGCAIVADSWTAQSRQILAAKPDLVIAAVPYQEKAVVEILKAGIRFLGLAPRTLADIYTDIETIAGVMGASERGQSVTSDMQREIEAVRLQTSNIQAAMTQPSARKRPRVFCEEWGKPLIASQKWVADLVEAAGGEFLGDPGLQRSPESVLADNPDIVVAAWCGAGDRVPLEKIVRDRGWEQMRAVQGDRVYCVRDELLNTPAPTLIFGLRALAGAIHPDYFPQAPGLKCILQMRGQVHAARP